MVEVNTVLLDSEMRSVAFVEHQKYEVHGTICTKAITLGDVDNDGVGSIDLEIQRTLLVVSYTSVSHIV